MRICVQGMTHLGSVTAACLASVGHDVVGFDFDLRVIEMLRDGKPATDEPGLAEAIAAGLDTGRLEFTSDPAVAVASAEIVWVAYDTPVDEEDHGDTDYVLGEFQKLGDHLPHQALVLVSSQIPVGSTHRLENWAAHQYPGKAIRFAYLPENLRLGKAMETFLEPDRFVVGLRDGAGQAEITRMLAPITDRIIWMSIESAEMTKHAINAFLGMSIAFANEIAALCEIAGADAREVEQGLRSESRIGQKAYLSPGAAFSGGTLARDIAFLEKIGTDGSRDVPLLSSVKVSNDSHKNWIRHHLRSIFRDLRGVPICVLGLTYKPGTNVLHRSLSVELCEWLRGEGAELVVHDPSNCVMPPAWRQNVVRRDSVQDAIAGARAIIVSTEWPEYSELSPEAFQGSAGKVFVFDQNRILPHLAKVPKVRYLTVGSTNE